MNGKGDTQRPLNTKYCTEKELADRWDRVFKKKEPVDSKVIRGKKG